MKVQAAVRLLDQGEDGFVHSLGVLEDPGDGGSRQFAAESLKYGRNPRGLMSLMQAMHRSTQRLGDYAVKIDDGSLILAQVARQRCGLWMPRIIGDEQRHQDRRINRDTHGHYT